MKVLLLNPPFKTRYGRFSRSSRSPAIAKSGTIYYPIFLCYVAGVLDEAGHEIDVIDSCAYQYDLQKTLRLINEVKPQLVVVDTSTPSIYSDVRMVIEIKKILPNIFVALMGTHPTVLPGETLQLSRDIDAVAVGEAEYTIRELAEKLSIVELKEMHDGSEQKGNVLGSIDGLAYRLGDEIRINKNRVLIGNLDELPFVSKIYKKYLDPRKYFFAASDYPEVQIMTSRGCPAKCTFCLYPQTMHAHKYRVRSPENIVDEFQWITINMPQVREIGIEDDTFTGEQKRVVEFSKELIKRNIRTKWYCNVRANLKYGTMLWMKKAGCVLVTVGYESADERILRNIRKKIRPEIILEFSKNTRKAGLLVHGCFMAGNRGETKATLEKSLRLALQLTDDTMQFFPLIVYPGTADYEWARQKDLMSTKDYSDYLTEDGCHNSVVRMPDMTSDEIRQWCDYARRKYYLRLSYIIYKILQQIRNPSEIRRTVKAAKRFVKFLQPQ